jgi:hypothetical protein
VSAAAIPKRSVWSSLALANEAGVHTRAVLDDDRSAPSLLKPVGE